MHWSHSAAGLAAALALATHIPAAQSAALNAGPDDVAAAPVAPPPAAAPSVQGQNAVGAPAQKRSARPSGAAKGSVLSILVYDHNSQHGFAASAAQNLSPFSTTVADSSNFNTLLASGSWDAVAVDCPSDIPIGGWTALINYVNGGGEAVLSFWDWDNSASYPTLPGAFDVSVSSTISLTGATLQNSFTSPAFLGVTMPNADWHGHWGDDGDQFNLLAGAKGLAHIGTASTPVIARGNGGKTIAAPVFDEAGDTWIGDGSAVQLWENMILMVGTQGPSILVYDDDTEHSLAQLAAFETSPGGTQVGNSSTFDAQLASGPWDAVLVDAPNSDPASGWTALVNYVNAGGHVAMSFWDWDNSSSGFGDPNLPPAFDVSVVSSYSWTVTLLTLTSSGVTDLFAGVSVPNNDWHDHFSDDGDRFTPLSGAKGLAHVGSAAQPVIVYGNAGRTIAAPVLDEAGDFWLGNGSGVQIWKNMLSLVSEPDASCTLRTGVLGLNPNVYTCITPPVVGGLWVANVSTTPLLGTATLTTFITIGIGGPITGLPIFGFELLILPPYFETTGLGTHNIPVSSDPTLVGVALPSQGARIELGAGGSLFVVLTNGQDLVFGF